MTNKKNIWVISSLRDSRGASIIIALAMIAAIMFFTIGMASTMIMAIQNTSDSKKALQAEYAAQSGVELANFFLKDKEVGSGESELEIEKCLDSDANSGDCLSKVQYTIKGIDDEDGVYTEPSGYRTIPIKGTGNAGSCSDSSNINDDCNWNKLYYGDSIEVPFYVGETTTTNLNKFDFKVRTPEGEGIAADSLIVLSWQLTGESCTNTSCVCVPQNGGISSADINDHISEGSVGAVFNFFWMPCIDSTETSDDPNTYLLDTFLGDEYEADYIEKPKLKISYVRAVEGSSGDIPYLEYQFAYEGEPLAAMYKVNITGISNSFKFYLNGVQGLGSGLFGFAVQN